MLEFPRWKIALILGVCLAGLLAALPNFMSEERAAALPDFLPSKQVTLGLDLQGSSHMLLEAEIESVVEERLADLEAQVREALRAQGIVAALDTSDNQVTARLRDAAQTDAALRAIRDLAQPVTGAGLVGGALDRNLAAERVGDGRIAVRLTEAAIRARSNSAVEQSLEVVRRRVDALGTREPTIQRQGERRILVQVPGLQDSQSLRDILETTAKLTFHMVHPNADPTRRPPPGYIVLPMADEPGSLVVERRPSVSGENLVDAGLAFHPETGEPVVSFRFDTTGGRKFADITRKHVRERFAIVLDQEIISAPVINEPILGGSGIIQGRFTVESADNLAILLNAGALPVPLTILEERTVGPDLGQDSIEAGQLAAVIGMIAVVVFMVLVYGRFGLAANVALLVNIVLILGALSAIGATLTLPGIAGIVLTIGMAVDANVLIFERIKEESRAGRPPLRALEAGYSQAMSTILDANITTLIAAFLLFQFGSGPVRGFAVTLSIGIVTSVFTAVLLTRMIMVLWLRRRRPAQLPI